MEESKLTRRLEEIERGCCVVMSSSKSEGVRATQTWRCVLLLRLGGRLEHVDLLSGLSCCLY